IISVSQTSLDIIADKYKFIYNLSFLSNGPSQIYISVYGSSADNFSVFWGQEGTKYYGDNIFYIPQEVVPTGGLFYVVVSGLDDDLVIWTTKCTRGNPF
ncbi:MAG: hypothetical protein ACPLPS_10245, partial [bacterium]